MQAFVIPNSQTHSCAPISYRIKPLCLHQRAQKLDGSRPCSTLTITGGSCYWCMLLGRAFNARASCP